MKRLIGPAFVACLVSYGVHAQTAGDEETSEAQATPTVSQAEGLEAWEGIYKVFSHPRCINCHTEDDRPRWSGPSYGEARIHGMNVKRGDGGIGMPGMRCSTCHGEENSAKLHGPPGHEGWHLAPVEMAWWEKSSAYICRQIKDPERNGNRTLEEVKVHVRDDGLVNWGWNPGPGREPAPGSAKETIDLLTKWVDAGAPCPQ